MRDPTKWLKALSGGAAYANFMRVSASALRRSVAARVGRVLGDGMPEGLAKDLWTIASRGVQSLFVFSHGDNGLQYFQWHAQLALRRARVRDFVQQLVVEGPATPSGRVLRSRRFAPMLIDFVESQTVRTDLTVRTGPWP